MRLPETITYTTEGRVATIAFNRPDAHNAMTAAMMAGVEEAFRAFDADDELWVAILTGTGDKAFCAGADLGELIPQIVDKGMEAFLGDPSKRFFSDIYKPIICAVNGLCVAGGLEIMQGTDLRIAAEHAVFGLGEVRWGIVPGGGSHIRLPRQIPWAVAMEILLTGRPISAERAFDVGLVNKVVPAADLMDEANALAELLCRNGPVAMRTAKEIAVRSLALETPFVLENLLVQRVFGTEDAREGPKAFMEKRRPDFTGR
ncbi:MAG: enoyl-CoA hydratase/isomerase family protein [Pseudonocardia sp.]